MTQLRPLRFWEQICSTMNISLGFELDGPITADLVAKAWDLVKQEYPYFASCITQDEHSLLYFSSNKVISPWATLQLSFSHSCLR